MYLRSVCETVETNFFLGDYVTRKRGKGATGKVIGLAIGADGQKCLCIERNTLTDHGWKTMLWPIDECEKADTLDAIEDEVRRVCTNRNNMEWVLKLLRRQRAVLERDA